MSSLSNAQSAALAFCLVSSAPESKIDAKVSAVKAPKAHKVNDGAMAAPKTTPAMPASNAVKPSSMVTLYPAGTLDAKCFLVALRRATNRDECIAVIAAYIGYDHTAPYGEQDSRARSQAQREINPVAAATKSHFRGATVSVGGFISGMPETTTRHIQNLLARERLAVETMLLNQELSNKASNDQEKTLYAGLALVEQDRLAEIRADLARSL